MDQKCNPIGVFDSGIGGISTLKEMIRELPREHFIYYGDTANAPYGTKSTEEVIGCVHKVVEHLQEKQIKALVIACNTATGAAAAVLRKDDKIAARGRLNGGDAPLADLGVVGGFILGRAERKAHHGVDVGLRVLGVAVLIDKVIRKGKDGPCKQGENEQNR